MSTAELPTPTPLPGQVDILPDQLEQAAWSRTLWQFLRFGLVGCINTLIDLLALNCLLWLLPAQNTPSLLLANSLAYALGALNSFLLNRYWTFRVNHPTNKGEVTRFIATTLAGIVCNDLILCLLNNLPHPEQWNATLWTNLTKIVSIGCTIFISYLGMRLWVFVQASQEQPGQARRFSPTPKAGGYATRVGTQEPAHDETQQYPTPRLTAYSLSLVLPAYNEEQVITATVERAAEVLTHLVQDFEIIVVNDGSVDRTGTILAQLSLREPHLRIVTHEHNQGYGATLADGFAAATKDLTFFMDSDGQFDIQELGRLLPFVQRYDAVLGYRIKRQDTWMRKLNAWGWKQVIRLVLGVRVRDIDCAFKVLHTSFLQANPLETRGAMINAELLYKLKRAGCSVREVGVRHLPRQGGRATGANLRVIGRAFRELFFYAQKWHREEHNAHHSPAAREASSLGQLAGSSDAVTTLAIGKNQFQARQYTKSTFAQRLALIGVMLTSIFMNFYQLGQNGFGNLFYAAGVRSMADSLHNFFFVSYDPGGFVTVDKPPLGFWLQTLSVKLFGFRPFSIFLPQALAGVLAVLVLFHLVRRHFGFAAGLLAALALALSPLSVETARNNTIDSTLVLTLLLGAWAIMLAAETGKWRWLLLSAALVGLGFNVKMMEAYLVVPAFGLLYLLAAPRPFWQRCGQLFVAVLVLLAVSLSWAIAVDLTPASARPYVGSSQNNSEISLAFGYNGVDRLLGRFGLGANHENTTNDAQPSRTHNANAPLAPNSNQAAPSTNQSTQGNGNNTGAQWGGHGFGVDSPGPLRLFNESLGGQISWLLPFALLALLALAWRSRPQFQKDRQQQALILWGTWLLTMGIFFSVAGFFHTYYMTTFAPAICALFGIGVSVMWRDYRRADWRGWLLPIALLATAAEQIHFIVSNPAWGTWLIPLIAILCVLAALGLSGMLLNPRLKINPRVSGLILAAGLMALLLTPAIWSVTPALQNEAISTPSAGPGHQENPGGFARDNAKTSPALLNYLEEHQGKATYLLATLNSMSADAFILATNKPVMAMGGFAGADPILTPSRLATLVSQGTVHFFLLNDPRHQNALFARGNSSNANPKGLAAFPWFNTNKQSALTNWITQHCSLVPATTWQSATNSKTASAPNSATLLYSCAASK